MTQYTKPTVLPAWGESAGGADVLQPSNAEIQAGWPLSNVPPSRKRFNWILKYLAQGMRYMMQRGIPEWDATEDYRINDRVMGSDGKTYKCIQAGVNKDPTTQTAYWTRWGFTLAEYEAEGTTPAQFDNSVKRASTAFVQRSLGNFQSGTAIAAGQVLTAADCGKVFSLNTSATPITLPAFNTVPSGAKISFVNVGSSKVVIQRSGTDTILGPSGIGASSFSNALTSYTLLPGDSAEFSAVFQWEITAGTCLLQSASSFAASKSGNGYQKFPSGLIIQWGTIGIPAKSIATVTFPIAFPNAGLTGYASKYDAVTNGTQYRWDCGAPGQTQMSIANNWADYISGSWFVIGY